MGRSSYWCWEDWRIGVGRIPASTSTQKEHWYGRIGMGFVWKKRSGRILRSTSTQKDHQNIKGSGAQGVQGAVIRARPLGQHPTKCHEVRRSRSARFGAMVNLYRTTKHCGIRESMRASFGAMVSSTPHHCQSLRTEKQCLHSPTLGLWANQQQQALLRGTGMQGQHLVSKLC